ncbi:hypothetical protein [Leptospira mayottensis]|uniref:hypothetical protein n=1 Tax=Leptospira mayottensis TaxID=1137606 RepID=UPI000E35C191|nr:hypothetical protein [Leptospira mayottensis]AXR68325.1 hypothetical protein DPV73_10105 [Leptospira mayottensis]
MRSCLFAQANTVTEVKCLEDQTSRSDREIEFEAFRRTKVRRCDPPGSSEFPPLTDYILRAEDVWSLLRKAVNTLVRGKTNHELEGFE